MADVGRRRRSALRPVDPARSRVTEAAPSDSQGESSRSELVRLVTCGSVDDGKSTLIGRLLFDTKQVFVDQMEHVEETSERRGDGYVNLALLTDGLRAEREQGITIDVAYRSFVTPRRRFQLADAPGHVQYTRNMVTGASTADVAIVLLDARKGVIEQTRRHAFIAALLGIPHLVFAVNKMDLVDYDEARFHEIEARARGAGRRSSASATKSRSRWPPCTATTSSSRPSGWPWWNGGTLLEHLESIEVAGDRDAAHRRFPVQWVIRPMTDEHHDYRGYAGQVAGGEWRAGDEVVVLPSGLRTRVAAVETHDGPLEVASRGCRSSIRLEDDLDVARGDMLADPADQPSAARARGAVCWMSERPVQPGARLGIKHTTRWARADSRGDRVEARRRHARGRARRRARAERHRRRPAPSVRPLLVDPYADNRATGAFVLVDEATNDTVAAGMVLRAESLPLQPR